MRWRWHRKPTAIVDEQAPWKKIKEDEESGGRFFSIPPSALISRLKNMFYPSLPFTSQKVHEYLGYEGQLEDSCGLMQPLLHYPVPGQKLRDPKRSLPSSMTA